MAALLAIPLGVLPAAVTVITTAPAAQAAALRLEAGMVGRTPVMGWSFLRMGSTVADLEKEVRAMVGTGLTKTR